MSNLGIFSLLVVGRDMPHPFARAAETRSRSAHRRWAASKVSRSEATVEVPADRTPEDARVTSA